MKRNHRSTWNETTAACLAMRETTSGGGGKSSSGGAAVALTRTLALNALALSVMLAFGTSAWALPAGGVVAAGGASISGGASTMVVTQSSQNVVINWQSFNIGATEAVRFVQPNSSSVALNRVLSSDPSSILGSLSANGQVFLVNPNGILFGRGASVNVGGLVASTRGISDGDFMAGRYDFSGTGNGSVVNQGTINADGGYVALLGASVSNEGVISAQLGSVVLAAGNAVTLDVAGDGLLNVAVNQGAVNALVQNGGLIRADGGKVLLTAQAAGDLLNTVVNNTGVIQAQTLQNRNGVISLMGDMQSGTVNVAGTIDASAPNGGNGGFIETSAAHVNVAPAARITTVAPFGTTGTWLIDPEDFIVGAAGNITGVALSNLLVTTSVTISTVSGGTDNTVAGTPPVRSLFSARGGAGDIIVNDVVTWTAAPAANPTTLTLNATRDVTLNAAVTAVDGNFKVCCGRDIIVREAISVTRGSVLLSAGRDVVLDRTVLNPLTAITVVDGNLGICAGRDINVNTAAIALTRGTLVPERSLGLASGVTLNAGTAGTGPGVGGGTVTFAALTPRAAITDANIDIRYNPTSYTMPNDYSVNFTQVRAPLTQKMLVFPGGADRAFDGTTAAVFTSLKGNPAGVALLAGPGATTAVFDSAAVGVNTGISFTGYTLTGARSAEYALPVTCCSPIVGRTTATITAAPIVVVPPLVLPVVPLAVLATGAAGGLILALADTGINLPSEELVAAPTPPPAPPIQPVPVVELPVPPPPPVYVAPAHPPRRDRN